MPSPTMTTIKAATVAPEDLDALEEFVTDVLDDGPLAEFLVGLIDLLRAGHDVVVASGDADVIAALTGRTP